MTTESYHYDVIIIGAGVAGSALAHSLSLCRPETDTALRIALIERSFSKPNRIVGELLQPGGMLALSRLGLSGCTEGIDAVTEYGYVVLYDGKQVMIPYPEGQEGRSFHHGEFVMQLRRAARRARGVDMIEATATQLIECPHTGRMLGVRVSRKDPSDSNASISESYFADITIAADGAYSKYRSALGGKPREPVTKSKFYGAILRHAPLPRKNHGAVSLIPGSGPVLMYQLDSTETRMLADIRVPAPRDIPEHIRTVVIPSLIPQLRPCVEEALNAEPLKSMPNLFLPAAMQHSSQGWKEGIILIGDAWNMRHPLTGGGMTVALNDVVFLTKVLEPFLQAPTRKKTSLTNGHAHGHSNGRSNDFGNGVGNGHSHLEKLVHTNGSLDFDWDDLGEAIRSWHWSRKGLASTVNILSIALYDLFSADDIDLHILREGCFAYFELGGECVNGPVSLLAGLAASPSLLARHFFTVAFYAMFIYLRKALRGESVDFKAAGKTHVTIIDYPAIVMRSFSVIWTAVVVFGPLVWSEIRWW